MAFSPAIDRHRARTQRRPTIKNSRFRIDAAARIKHDIAVE
jgi:hypothetical protein